ncbi:PNMA, partial [Pristimantis euphronides]
MSELYQLYGIERSRTTPYHPQGNGACERFNRTLLQMLRTLEDTQKARWPDYLPELMWAYNNREHSTTGYSPHMLMFGRPGREIEELHMPDPKAPPPRNTSAWAQDHRRRLRVIHKVVGERLKQVVHPNPRSVHGDSYNPGDRVMVRAKRPSGKLDGRWEAVPYVVKRKVGTDIPVYEVEPVGTGGPVRNLHRNMLRHCNFESTHEDMEPIVPTVSEIEAPIEEDWWAPPISSPSEPPTAEIVPLGEESSLIAPPVPEVQTDAADIPTVRRTTRSNAGIPPQRYAQEQFEWGGLSRTPTSSGVACK